MTETTRLKRLIKLCKDNCITRLKLDSIELEFAAEASAKPAAIPVPKPAFETKFEHAQSDDPALQMPGDDEMLFFATEYYDELKASRKDA